MSPDPVSTAARGATHLRSLDGDAPDEAVDQLLVHADHLRDPWTGLFRHIWVETPDHYPQGTFWARGNGWAAAAAVDVLERLPDDHLRRRRRGSGAAGRGTARRPEAPLTVTPYGQGWYLVAASVLG